MAGVKINITYDAAKLVRKFPDIVEELSEHMADRAKVFFIKNTEKGKDIHGKDFAPLKPVTLEMRKRGAGKYKTPIQHNKPLIASRNMIQNKMKRIFDTKTMSHGLEVRGYGVYHYEGNSKTNLPQRKWFGLSEHVLKNIIDNKKLRTFRKQVSRAFKK